VGSVRLEVAELSPAALEAARADALALFVGPERPLLGLAGHADWVLAGAVSRALRSGTYGGEAGEQLLLPTGGRLQIPRAFCFGVSVLPSDEASYRAVAYRALDALFRAGSRSQAVALPPFAHGALDPATAARLWIEAVVRFPPERQLVLGDAPALRRDLGAARDALGARVEVVAAEPPERAAALPGGAAMVR